MIMLILLIVAVELWFKRILKKLPMPLDFMFTTLLLTIGLYLGRGHLKFSFQVSVLMTGSIALIYYLIGLYGDLKSKQYHFRYLPKDVWFRLGWICLYVYGTFVIFLPWDLLLLGIFFPPILLIVLLIIDVIGNIFRFR